MTSGEGPLFRRGSTPMKHQPNRNKAVWPNEQIKALCLAKQRGSHCFSQWQEGARLAVKVSCSGMLILTQTNLQRFCLLLEPLIKIVIFRETKQGLARRTSSHVQHFHNTSYVVTCHWPQNGDVPQYPCLHSVCSVFTVLLYVQVGAASGGDSRRKGENCPLHQFVLACRTQLVGSIQMILCIAHFMMLNSI